MITNKQKVLIVYVKFLELIETKNPVIRILCCDILGDCDDPVIESIIEDITNKKYTASINLLTLIQNNSTILDQLYDFSLIHL